MLSNLSRCGHTVHIRVLVLVHARPDRTRLDRFWTERMLISGGEQALTEDT